MEKGNLIVVEGACDGIGKTTQYNMLSNRLINNGEEIKSHHFPSYGTYHGYPVEQYLKGEYFFKYIIKYIDFEYNIK